MISSRHAAALAMVVAGFIVLIVVPQIPGGERLARYDPPGADHVTDLILADDGTVWAGTQGTGLWHLVDGIWAHVDLALHDQPITALPRDLSEGPIGTAGGLINRPPGTPGFEKRVGDMVASTQGLVVASGAGVFLQGRDTWEQSLAGIFVYRLWQTRRNGVDYLYAGTVDHGVYMARLDEPLEWQPDSTGIPAESDVFSFATTAAGQLIVGTDQGLFWQPEPMDEWQPLAIGLDVDRTLSLYIETPDDAPQRLWVGGANGLFRATLIENDPEIELVSAEPIAVGPEPVRFGVSWIVPYGDGVLFSAGDVYRYGVMGLPGWMWISAAGLVLILVGGWWFARSMNPKAN